MFLICTYDVNEKRCNKVMKILKKYLFHIQNSVFEGTLTPKQFLKLKSELSNVVKEDDSVLFYINYNETITKKEFLGTQNSNSPNIIF